ncbi:MAG: hypothetical protein LBV09_00055 [Deferribacteraceae bacterium]|jgi:hypothetical protein|nr:hypothetical protein [Deferribacteraceae bacterium]
MPEYIFVNPSPNMNLAAKSLSLLGRDVQSIFTKDFVQTRPTNLWAFIGTDIAQIVEDKGLDADTNITTLKKPFFTNRFNSYVKNKFNELNPKLSYASYQDYILLSATLWREDSPKIELSSLTFEEVLAKHPTSKIVTSKVPHSGGRCHCIRWHTDFDVEEALGDDCYFYFDGKQVHQLYRMGGDIVTVSEQKNSIEWLKKVNPTFNRFTFEKVGAVTYHKNVNPWLLKYSSKVILMNDYSWQGISAQLPESWAKGVAKYLNGEVKKAKEK